MDSASSDGLHFILNISKSASFSQFAICVPSADASEIKTMFSRCIMGLEKVEMKNWCVTQINGNKCY